MTVLHAFVTEKIFFDFSPPHSCLSSGTRLSVQDTFLSPQCEHCLRPAHEALLCVKLGLVLFSGPADPLKLRLMGGVGTGSVSLTPQVAQYHFHSGEEGGLGFSV